MPHPADLTLRVSSSHFLRIFAPKQAQIHAYNDLDVILMGCVVLIASY